MSPEPMDAVMDWLIATAVPSSGPDLAGFGTDLDHALYISTVLAGFSMKGTDDPRGLLSVEATVSDTANTLQDVSRALVEIWMATAYHGFEASACVRYRDATVLRFATHLSSANVFVTGRIVASGGPYARLVDKFERDLGRLAGPLPVFGRRD